MVRPNKSVFLRFLRDQSGATAVEYGLLIGIIAIACVVAFTSIGGSLSSILGAEEGGVSNELSKAAKP